MLTSASVSIMASKNIYYAEVKLMDLSSFFRENAIKTHEIKYVASNRFVDKDNQPIEWILTPITSQTDEDLRRQATNKIKRPLHSMYSSYLHVVSFLSTPQKLKVRIESNYKFQ